MKKISVNKFLGILLLLTAVIACNNSTHEKSADEMRADSLDNDIENLHGGAMGKSLQLTDVQKKVEAALDSISKLPANLQPTSAPYKLQLDSLLSRMKFAQFAMEKWMEDYKYDSLKDDVQKRIEYLESEKTKVEKVKEAIVSTLKNADSIIIKK